MTCLLLNKMLALTFTSLGSSESDEQKLGEVCSNISGGGSCILIECSTYAYYVLNLIAPSGDLKL